MHGIAVIFALQAQANTTFKNSEFGVSLWKSQTMCLSAYELQFGVGGKDCPTVLDLC